MQWEEGAHDRVRRYFVEERHCRDCLVELMARRDGLVVWFRRGWSDEEDPATRVKGTRRIGRHCAFRWERCDDVVRQGRPVRLYWIERQHCAECVRILRAMCVTEQDAELIDLAARGVTRPPSRPDLPAVSSPPGAAPRGRAPRGDGGA